MQDVRARVVRLCRIADAPGDNGLDAVSRGEALASEDELLVVLEPQRLDELRTLTAFLLDHADVRHLPAARRVERRLLELRLEETVAQIGVGGDRREHFRALVADELSARRVGEAHVDLQGTGAPRDLAMLLHEPCELLVVDAEAALARELLRQLDRKAVG